MIRILFDHVLGEKLGNFSQPIELCDESRNIIARILPLPGPEQYERLEPTISPEELKHRRQDKGETYTTEEVLAHLQKL